MSTTRIRFQIFEIPKPLLLDYFGDFVWQFINLNTAFICTWTKSSRIFCCIQNFIDVQFLRCKAQIKIICPYFEANYPNNCQTDYYY